MGNISTTKGPRPAARAKEKMEGVALLASRLCGIKTLEKPLKDWLRVKPALEPGLPNSYYFFMQSSLKPNETFEINSRSGVANQLIKTWFIIIQRDDGDFDYAVWEWHYEKDASSTRREIERMPATMGNGKKLSEMVAEMIKRRMHVQG